MKSSFLKDAFATWRKIAGTGVPGAASFNFI
jgi:hypothetical protein